MTDELDRKRLAIWDEMRSALKASMVILENVPWPDDLGEIRPILERRRDQIKSTLEKVDAIKDSKGKSPWLY